MTLPTRFFSLFLICFCLLPLHAYARIDIIPRKIVMDSRDRSSEITILNMFNKEGTFRVDVMHHRQNEDGTYTILDTPLDVNFDTDKTVRFSPRQFTLPSQGRQKIRISLRKPAELAEGEYRFHVKVLRLADLDNASTVPVNQTGISMKMNVGVSIPVVVRHGNLESQAKMTKTRLVSGANTERGRPELHMTIERTGTQSTIGSLEALWEPDGHSESDRIGYIDNMNIFTDVERRHVQLPLKYVPKGAGVIRLRYVENGLEKTKGTVYDELLLEQ